MDHKLREPKSNKTQPCCTHLDVDGDEWVLDGDDEPLVPHRVQVLVDRLALVGGLREVVLINNTDWG